MFDDVDLIVVTDYTTMDISPVIRSHIEGYDEIVVISWSFGVAAATRFIEENSGLPITLRMAVNGTPFPVDDDRGIPTDIFEGTLDNLSEITLKKFDRRMCGIPVLLKRSRGIESLKEELRSIRSNFSGNNVSDTSVWDVALIGDRDNIIPTHNQLRAWEGHTPTEVIDSPHYPDFKKIIGSRIINKRLMGRNFARRARDSYDQNAIAQARIARHLSDKLQRQKELGYLKGSLDCLEIGVGTGMLTRLYYPILATDGLAANDNGDAGLTVSEGGRSGRTSLPHGSTLTLCDISFISECLPGERVICDAETYIRSLPPDSCDLILGASVIQWFQSPGRFIEECSRVLRPGGILLLSTFSPDNYYELSTYLDVRLNGPDKDGWSLILSRNFDSYEVEEECIPVDFATPRDLLYHMKATGVNGVSGDSVASQRSVRQLLGSGLTRLTYCPIYLYARK